MVDKDANVLIDEGKEAQGLKAKRKLKLSIPVSNQPEPVLSFNHETSSFLLQGEIKQRDESDTNSSSVSKVSNKFFGKEALMNFDFEGQFYAIRARNNGKFMEDKCIVIPVFKISEGCSFYGVYDGHSTDMIAEMLKEKLHEYIMESYFQQGSILQALSDGFEKIEKDAISKLKQNKQLGGSTALCAVIKDGKIYLANAGDSRAVLVSDSEVKTLNNLHDFSNKSEETAVGARGGVIIERGIVKRLQGELAISRSIGDFNYKEYISSAPEISEHNITPSDNFLLLATDGYWNVISPEATAETIRLIQNDFKELNSVERISEYLIEKACNTKQNSKKDNMVLITVDLKKLADKKIFLNFRKSLSETV